MRAHYFSTSVARIVHHDKFDLAAKREGWAVFDCDGELQVCRLDDPEVWVADLGFLPPQLDDDAHAWLIVRTGTGAHHADARKILSEQSPTEWKRVNEWYEMLYPRGMKP